MIQLGQAEAWEVLRGIKGFATTEQVGAADVKAMSGQPTND